MSRDRFKGEGPYAVERSATELPVEVEGRRCRGGTERNGITVQLTATRPVAKQPQFQLLEAQGDDLDYVLVTPVEPLNRNAADVGKAAPVGQAAAKEATDAAVTNASSQCAAAASSSVGDAGPHPVLILLNGFQASAEQ